MQMRSRHKALLATLIAALAPAVLGAAVATVSRPALAQKDSQPRTRRPKGLNRDKGPAESRQERDARLRRECRDKPNSGACEGYGS